MKCHSGDTLYFLGGGISHQIAHKRFHKLENLNSARLDNTSRNKPAETTITTTTMIERERVKEKSTLPVVLSGEVLSS